MYREANSRANALSLVVEGVDFDGNIEETLESLEYAWVSHSDFKSYRELKSPTSKFNIANNTIWL